MNNKGFTLVELLAVLVLLALVLTYTVKYFKINKTAGFLNIPYIVWLVFAGIINFSVYLLN